MRNETKFSKYEKMFEAIFQVNFRGQLRALESDRSRVRIIVRTNLKAEGERAFSSAA